MIKFLRKKDFKFIKEIGQGACGKTILLMDEIINEQFVCKKYSPIKGLNREELFKKFIDEIKLLHLLYHKNIVRVFNYYIYPDLLTGYIIMEYIEGSDIETFIKSNPEKISDIFRQTIDGFNYLENQKILHRDIRPYNLLVDSLGFVKIIDFGFGKQIMFTDDYDKSITLNWNCDILPSEFKDHLYDFRTEIYFVGKLFEKIIAENDIQGFVYKDVLNKMIKVSYDNRIDSFSEINRLMLSEEAKEYDMDYYDKIKYQTFADQLIKLYSKISYKAKYKNDITVLIKQLEDIYQANLLEHTIQNNVPMIRCFIQGNLSYYKEPTVSVDALYDFIALLKKYSVDLQKIILNNLWNRFDTIPRFEEQNNEDLPF